MQRRGPDGAGEWWSADKRVAFGHRRLAIVDLSDRGSQPMVSADGRLVIVYNGEIYNHVELRRELQREGLAFESRSDTEVLLHLYARWGLDMFPKLRGMFALAIWDVEHRKIVLARDPYGIKPLYYTSVGGTLRFASQVKALLAGGGLVADPDPAGIVGFHIWGSVPEPFTLYRNVQALPAGHTLVVDARGVGNVKKFATVADCLASAAVTILRPNELGQRIRSAVLDSVGAHLVADVEVGVFLSAGIDSGAVLGLMRDAGRDRVPAITLDFSEYQGSSRCEALVAAKVAHRYGARHFVRRVTAAEFSNDLPRLLDAMDQPSIDGVNTWMVSKAAREAGLKVALSGVGGDELFSGYPSFVDIPRWVRWLRLPSKWQALGVGVRRVLYPLALAVGRPKMAGLVEYGGTFSGAYLLRRALLLPFELSQVVDPEILAEGLATLQPQRQPDALTRGDFTSVSSRVTALESSMYLRNQLLRDADWAGMDQSLEIRTPLVDFQLLRAIAPVIRYAGNGQGKLALANAPSQPLPPEVIQRPKTGFEVPIGAWMTGSTELRHVYRGLSSRLWAGKVFKAFQ